jgi:4-amino-4-deoxy-L-arabinose transferase-like glycosyltransferase
MIGPNSCLWRDTAFLWALALFNLVLHLATASRLDFYIDELYAFVIMPKYSLMGYVDGSAFPLGIWLSLLPTIFLGSTKFALRIAPAVVGSANIVAAGLLARELGGRCFAVSLTGLAVFVSPFLMFTACLADTFSFEGLPWSLSALFIVRLLRTGNGRLWWLVGMAWGAGLMTKPIIIPLMMAVGFGLLLTRARAELMRKGYWLALVLAFVLFSPALLWQAVHGWPFLRFMGDLQKDEWAESGFWLGYFSRSKLLLAQPAFLGPLNCILAIVGLFCGPVSGRERTYRVVLWACMATGLALLATSGRPFYWYPAYSILLAFGCAATAQITAGKKALWIRPVLIVGLVVQGLLVAPVCMPLLPKDLLGSYSRLLCRGILAPLSSTAEVLQGSDQYEKLEKALNGVYTKLPADDRKNCIIIIGWAPAAAGAEYYGAKDGLPKIFSPHLNYIFWGPPSEDAGPVIALSFNREELEGWFGRVELADRFLAGAPPIYLCRFPKCPYQKIWQEMCKKDSNFRWKVDLGAEQG